MPPKINGQMKSNNKKKFNIKYDAREFVFSFIGVDTRKKNKQNKHKHKHTYYKV